MNCAGCGACCMEQGSPPGYLLLMRDPDKHPDWPDREDIERVKSMPPEARRAIAWYRRDLLEGRNGGEGPCCWLNLQTMRCGWYEWRPQICRDLEVGSDGCLGWVKLYHIKGADDVRV